MKNNESHLTCVLCPKGCVVKITRINKSCEITGFQCDRGKEYALRELVNPARVLTTTVRTDFKDFPRLPVKTDREIPLTEIFDFMKEINSIRVKKRLKPGDTVEKQLLGSDINLIATDDMTQLDLHEYK